MFRSISIICSCLFVLSGCIYNTEPVPRITEVYAPLPQPKYTPPMVTRPEQSLRDIPKDWLVAPGLEKKWTAIIIHHSETTSGNMAVFDNYHKNDHKWKGIGYDFVIGNGNGSGDGQVEVTFRWRKQIDGAHCGGTLGNWANKYGVGICLVGSFNHSAPTSRQIQSLIKLTRFLQKRYAIGKNQIYGHNTTPGASPTDCPGKKFPMAKLKSIFSF